MALSQKQKRDLSGIINGLMVASFMMEKATAEKDDSGCVLFLRKEYRLTIELADKYDIELPTLNQARIYMAEHPANEYLNSKGK